MRIAISIVVWIGALAGAIDAQQIWIVDSSGSAGSNFRDLQSAFDAAAAGDTVVVRKGSYGYATTSTSKGLRVLGLTGATISGAPSGADLLRVTGLPAGQTFVLKGFQMSLSEGGVGAVLRLDNCAGRVQLESLEIRHVSSFMASGVGVSAQNCSQVTMASCNLLGWPAFSCASSAVSITNSALRGLGAGSYRLVTSWPSQPAIVAQASRLHLAWSQATGGMALLLPPANQPASPALRMVSTSAIVSGDASVYCVAGYPGALPTAAAIMSSGGDLLVDPSVAMSAPAHSGTAVVTTRRLPALRAAFAPGVLGLELFARAGDPFVIVGGYPADRVSTPIGELWIDASRLLLLDQGVIDPTEHRLAGLPVPPDPALAGFSLALLAATSSPSAGLQLASPVTVVLF